MCPCCCCSCLFVCLFVFCSAYDIVFAPFFFFCSVSAFCFRKTVTLSPFGLDDFADSLHYGGGPSVMVAETHTRLLSVILRWVAHLRTRQRHTHTRVFAGDWRHRNACLLEKTKLPSLVLFWLPPRHPPLPSPPPPPPPRLPIYENQQVRPP